MPSSVWIRKKPNPSLSLPGVSGSSAYESGFFEMDQERIDDLEWRMRKLAIVEARLRLLMD